MKGKKAHRTRHGPNEGAHLMPAALRTGAVMAAEVAAMSASSSFLPPPSASFSRPGTGSVPTALLEVETGKATMVS
jgi:hypothetical protein